MFLRSVSPVCSLWYRGLGQWLVAGNVVATVWVIFLGRFSGSIPVEKLSGLCLNLVWQLV